MSTDLGRRFPPDVLRSPPHMSPEDVEIYRSWWPQFIPQAVAVYYDVGLGKGAADNLPLDAQKNYARGWVRVTQKRADMIAVMKNGLWLIELRHAATSNAVGRLLLYKLLWEEDPVLPGQLSLFLVSNHMDPDLRTLCTMSDISYHWV